MKNNVCKIETCIFKDLLNKKDNLLTTAVYLLQQASKKSITDLTNLKLQKLMFYSYTHFLVKNKNEKFLFTSKIEAWPYGPVIPDLYFLFRENQGKPIDSKYFDIEINEEELIGKDSVDYIIKKYGKKSGIELTDQTHQEDPWVKAWSFTQNFEDKIITNKNIFDYYGKNKL